MRKNLEANDIRWIVYFLPFALWKPLTNALLSAGFDSEHCQLFYELEILNALLSENKQESELKNLIDYWNSFIGVYHTQTRKEGGGEGSAGFKISNLGQDERIMLEKVYEHLKTLAPQVLAQHNPQPGEDIRAVMNRVYKSKLPIAEQKMRNMSPRSTFLAEYGGSSLPFFTSFIPFGTPLRS